MSKQYSVDPDVLNSAQRLGLYGETAEARIKEMAKLAAKFTHPDANHRYRQYIMYIEDDGRVSMLDVMDTEEKEYLNKRTYEERKLEAEPQEAVVEYKGGRTR